MRSGTVPERPVEVVLRFEELEEEREEVGAENLRRLVVEGTNWSKGISSSESDKATGFNCRQDFESELFILSDFEELDNPDGPGTSSVANGEIDSDFGSGNDVHGVGIEVGPASDNKAGQGGKLGGIDIGRSAASFAVTLAFNFP